MQKAIEITQVTKATRRIPREMRGVTVYSVNDEWRFEQSDHPNMCGLCHSYNGNTYFGSELRFLFYHHVVLTENLIYAHVHPNCECTLVRVYPVEEYEFMEE